MSHDRPSSKKEEEKNAARFAIVFTGGILLVAIGVPLFAEMGWPRLHGTTPAQLAAEPLLRSPKQLASDLPSSEVSGDGVRVRFRVGTAGEYERAEFQWESGTRDAPNSMKLKPEYHHEHEKNETDVIGALRRHLPGLDDGRHKWGPVSIRGDSDGTLRFEVDRQVNGQANPLFDRQIEAARELIMNAAFDTPVNVSQSEIADVLGAGYPPAVLAKFDVTTPIENAGTALHAIVPAAMSTRSGVYTIPLDHPLVSKVRMSWRNQRGGTLSDLSLTTTKLYATNRSTLEACFEKKLGPPKVSVTDYAAGKKNFTFGLGGAIVAELDENSFYAHVNGPIDALSFDVLFHTLDACREASESGAKTK